MKQFLLSLCTLLCIHFVIAQSKPTTVNGLLSRPTKEAVKLYTVNHGRLEEIAASRPDTSGRFGFLFYPAVEGFYIIGVGSEQILMDKHSFISNRVTS
ncbi:hypothetical protein [Paraflavitalea speifideaquila]|uniref:hypothetical protein n=1 Tax=Paraflavitalea speifideaquila TaxID=3076558 RepID=UPI0028E368E2|nr:hypothetical protein [Paraflavitalea speifideiaquila]